MFPSVSCFVSPRNGDAPLKLKGQHARSLFVISSGALRFQLIIQSQYNSQYICDDADAPVKEQHKVNPKLCQAAWCTAGITKALTTCPPPIPAAHSWLSLELKIDSTHCCITRSQTQSPLFTLKLIKKNTYQQIQGSQKCFWILPQLRFCAQGQSRWVWCVAGERSSPGALYFQAEMQRGTQQNPEQIVYEQQDWVMHKQQWMKQVTWIRQPVCEHRSKTLRQLKLYQTHTYISMKYLKENINSICLRWIRLISPWEWCFFKCLA